MAYNLQDVISFLTTSEEVTSRKLSSGMGRKQFSHKFHFDDLLLKDYFVKEVAEKIYRLHMICNDDCRAKMTVRNTDVFVYTDGFKGLENFVEYFKEEENVRLIANRLRYGYAFVK